MRIVMTLVVRDEAEIIEDQLDYHLAAGVDFVIVTDHRSHDETAGILEEYARRGVVRLIREDREFVRLGDWQTRMARLAATEHGADWVVTSDADEFWWPHGPSIRETLTAIPPGYGVVRGVMQSFVPLKADSGPFVERMTVRLAPNAPINDPTTPYRPAVKVAHRAGPDVVVAGAGGHDVSGVPGGALVSWYPFDVLHFPLRTRDQCARKYRKTWTGWETNLRADLSQALRAEARGHADVVWDRVALDEAEVADGLEAGVLVVDTRLRDALRAARDTAHPSAPHTVARPSEVDAAVFEEAELVRSSRWIGDLEARVARVEARTARAQSLRIPRLRWR